jgi:uncharacterized protein YjiS (DUF1127 family)
MNSRACMSRPSALGVYRPPRLTPWLIARPLRALVAELHARAATRHLRRLDDHLLADLGLARSDIASVVRGRTYER